MQHITVPEDNTAIAAFIMDGDYMMPQIRPGQLVMIDDTPPEPGDCGLFSVGGNIVLRQYCADSFGNIYLFALNRERRELDISVPSGAAIQCLGRILLEHRPPLPLN